MSTKNFIEFEVRKAVKDGFTNQFFFKEGVLIHGPESVQTFLPDNVIKDRRPCLNSENIIYRITTPTNVKGFLIVPRYQDEQEVPFA